jgi:hypothetical protein
VEFVTLPDAQQPERPARLNPQAAQGILALVLHGRTGNGLLAAATSSAVAMAGLCRGRPKYRLARVSTPTPRRPSSPPSRNGKPAAGRSAAPGPRRILGAPDLFVWLPVAGLLLWAGLIATVGASVLLGVLLLVVAGVLVLFEAWANH